MAVLMAACGGDGPDSQVGRGGTGPTTTASAITDTTPPRPHAAPRWETVATFSGGAPQVVPELSILPGAIQWRVRWSCESGDLSISTTPPPRRPGPIVDSPCPKSGEAFSIHTGLVRLDVDASGPWKAIIDQQVDIPLDEPPPPDVAGAQVAGEGAFYDVEKSGKGNARLFRLDDGRRILRFEDCEVSNNTDLFVWLTDAAEPRTSAEAVKAQRVVLGNLKSTLGNQNYEVPADVPPERMRSVVIWCEPVAIVYSAARLAG